MQRQIWRYGDYQPVGLECEVLDNENFDQVEDHDLVLVPEGVGFIVIQDLCGGLPANAQILVVCESTNSQGIQKWKSIGCRAVTEQILPHYLEEVLGSDHVAVEQPDNSQATRMSQHTSRPIIKQESLRPQKKKARQLPDILRQQQIVPTSKKSPKTGGFFQFGWGRKNNRRRDRRESYREPERHAPWFQEKTTHGRIISVVSPRGRMGKSLFVGNAAALCVEAGLSTLVIESGDDGNLASILNHNPKVTMSDLLLSEEFSDIEEYIDTSCEYGFHGLFAGADGETLDENALMWLKKELERIRKKYSVIFIDLSPEHNSTNIELLRLADEVLYFVQPDVEMQERTSERYRLLVADESEGYGLHVDSVYPVFTRVKKGAHTIDDCNDVARYFSNEPIAEIHEVPDMHKYVRSGELLSWSKPSHRYSKEVHKILEYLNVIQTRRKRGLLA